MLVLTLLISLIGTIGASAASSPISVTAVAVAGKSSDVEANESDYKVTASTIDGMNVVFHNVGDYLKLKVTVKNNDGVAYKVTSVKDNIENKYLEFDYSGAAGKTLNASGTTDLYITVKYKTGVGTTYDEIAPVKADDPNLRENNRLQQIEKAELDFTFNYEAPATGDISSSGMWIALLSLSALGLAVLAFTGKKGKRAAEFMGLLFAFMLVVPVSANATSVTAKVYLTADFQLMDKLIVTYDGDNDTDLENVIVDYNKAFETKAAVTKEGYAFTCWKADNTAETTVEAGATYTALTDTTLTAQWTQKYTISYTLNGGSPADGQSNPEEYTALTPTFTLVNPTKEGATFIGWIYEGASSPVESVSIALGSTGNKSYTAVFATMSNTTISNGNDNTRNTASTVTLDTNSGIYTVVQNGKSYGWGATPEKSGFAQDDSNLVEIPWGSTYVWEFEIKLDTDGTFMFNVDPNTTKQDESLGNDFYGDNWLILDGVRYEHNGFARADSDTGTHGYINMTKDDKWHKVRLYITNNNETQNSSKGSIYCNRSTLGFNLIDVESNVTYEVKNVKSGVYSTKSN